MNMQQLWDSLGQDGTWSSYYDESNPLRSYNFITRREAVEKLLEADGKYERILDIGCGTGDYMPLAEQHDGTFFGIDYAAEMIRRAVADHPGQGEQHMFLVGSGEQLPYADNSFDLAVAMGYIEYFADPAIPLGEIQRVLKPGGVLVMQSFKWSLFSNLRRLVWQPLRRAVGSKGQDDVPTDWVNNKYSRRQLDALVARHGFARRGGVFNNFHVFPVRLRVKFPRLYIRLSEAITHTSPGAGGFLAANYIGKYVLQDK